MVVYVDAFTASYHCQQIHVSVIWGPLIMSSSARNKSLERVWPFIATLCKWRRDLSLFKMHPYRLLLLRGEGDQSPANKTIRKYTHMSQIDIEIEIEVDPE